jgi:hypothetical protein
MTWLAWTAIGIGGWLLLAVLICGMFALGKRADRRMAEALREAKG